MTQGLSGGIVRESGQGMHAAKSNGRRVVTELGDGGGEAFGAQAGDVPHRAVLVDAPAPVRDDQRTGTQPQSLPTRGKRR